MSPLGFIFYNWLFLCTSVTNLTPRINFFRKNSQFKSHNSLPFLKKTVLKNDPISKPWDDQKTWVLLICCPSSLWSAQVGLKTPQDNHFYWLFWFCKMSKKTTVLTLTSKSSSVTFKKPEPEKCLALLLQTTNRLPNPSVTHILMNTSYSIALRHK